MKDETMLRVIHALMSGDEEEKKKLLADLGGVDWGKYLEFTNKEISSMPQKFRKLFRVNKLRAYIRERRRGNSVNYEVRCRMDGISISAGGTTKTEARERFIEKLNALETRGAEPAVPVALEAFSLYYFEKFRRRKVSPETYRLDMSRCKKHIFPALGAKNLHTVTPSDCQDLLDGITAKGYGKTADEVHSLLNQIFKGAISHGIIARNPLSVVVHTRHAREHGKALTRAQEAVLAGCASPYRVYLLIALYTGMRPNEYKTLRREGDMLIAKNSKRKNGRVEYKRIPINPMLAPVIGDMQAFDFPTEQTLYKHVRSVLGCSLYDLRTTFYTRCRECGVADAARDEMVGHSSGVLADAYTDLSDAFLRREAAKISYLLHDEG